jgi:hypothetical protein
MPNPFYINFIKGVISAKQSVPMLKTDKPALLWIQYVYQKSERDVYP